MSFNNYGLIATAKQINLDSIIEKHGVQKTREWLTSLTDEELAQLQADPYFGLRVKQVIPWRDPAYFGTFALPGRSFGKNHCGSCFVSERALFGYGPLMLIGQSVADVRNVMVEAGPSSILQLYKNTKFMPEYIPSKRQLIWPNGMMGITYSGDSPDQLRGSSGATCYMDELAKFQYPDQLYADAVMGLRESDKPYMFIGTTPRPLPIIKELYGNGSYHKVTGTSLENEHTPQSFKNELLKRYEGTSRGRQEIYGEILWESEGALWKREFIDSQRKPKPDFVNIQNIIIAVDPASGSGLKRNDSTGIIIACSVLEDDELHAYILEDRTLRGSPKEWAKEVEQCLIDYPHAQVLAESNAGGVMVEEVLTKYGVPKLKIQLKHHIKSKYDRAQPVALAAEKGLIHHCGVFGDLEDELCSYTGGPKEKSPNRLDALVIAIHALLIKRKLKWVSKEMGV